MKSILSSTILLATLTQSSRLLQQTDACALVRCGADGKTECHVNPVNGAATCCVPDSLCSDADYQSTDVAICMDDGGVQKYDNKCFGRCDGNKACGQLCTCDTDADCITGYQCVETPFGFAGCDENVGDSCFGFCAKFGQGSCGGFVGVCPNTDEACYLDDGPNPLGDCYGLPDTCLDIFTPFTTEIPSCGGIDYCESYQSDSCGNVCSCDSRSFESCTEMACGTDPASFEPTCTECMDGFKPSTDGLSCEPDLGCFCPLFFDPVCCDGKTYGNTCQAICGRCSGTITPGACTTSCAATTCPTGQQCIDRPESGAICVDQDVCCPPLDEILAENPFACFEGCACCPWGEWSGSIGDGKTFCEGLVQGVDEFGTICDSSDIETVECVNQNDCDSGYKCQKDPICKIDSSISCGQTNKVCVDYQRTNVCSSDAECNAYNGEICLSVNGLGICVSYQSP